MKIFITTLLLSSFFLLNIQAQDIQQHDARAKKIDLERNGYTDVIFSDADFYKESDPKAYSKEGESVYNLGMIHLSKHYKRHSLKKIALKFSGPNSILLSEYYFDSDQVFLVQKTRLTYNASMHSDAYKKEETDTTKHRYYFKEGSLVISSDKKAMQDKSIVQDILSDATLYQKSSNIMEPAVYAVQKATNFKEKIVDIDCQLSLSEVTLTDENGDILRFLYSFSEQIIGRLYPYEVAYLHNDFEDGFLRKINYLDSKGQLKNIPYSEKKLEVASLEFELKNIDLLKQKLADIDDQDGNIETNDKKKKLVLKKYLSATGEVVKQEYIDSDEYWKYQNLIYRP
ncbi:MAG: hypothetical protein GY810_13250 [Aureispira sp.]|nr:hypothetical protein [Aureispira sp.]